MKIEALRSVVFAAGLSLAVLCTPATAQTAGQDMHDAGHETKAATTDAARGTAKGTKKAYHKTAHGTKKVAHSTAHGTSVAAKKTENGTKKVWHGTENLGDRVADKPATH